MVDQRSQPTRSNQDRVLGVIEQAPAARRLRTILSVGLTLIAVLVVLLLILLTQATNNRDQYEHFYTRLVWINGVLAVALFAVTTWFLIRLGLRLRRQQFGAQLLLKLAAIFGLLGVLPGVVIYGVSYQFVARSIESWFDVRIEGALTSGLQLGQSTLDMLRDDLERQVQREARLLADQAVSQRTLALEALRERVRATEVVLWSGSGHWLANAAEGAEIARRERLPAAVLKQVRNQTTLSRIDGLDDQVAMAQTEAAASKEMFKPSIVVLTTLPYNHHDNLTDAPVIEVTQRLPDTLVQNAIAVQGAHREYQERSLARDGLQRMYISTLTLSLFLAVFGALVFAGYWGHQLLQPLLLLARGMRQVAAGDLSPKTIAASQDELGELTRSFATMTRQLSDARTQALETLHQLDSAREALQTVMDTMSPGVLVLDAYECVRTSNPSVPRVLRLPENVRVGARLSEVPGLAALAHMAQQEFAQQVPQESLSNASSSTHEASHWQRTLELHGEFTNTTAGEGLHNQAATLIVRGALLPDGDKLLVLDDISEVLSAQRARAWADVARRLAHEIKNPLTPIQLSAERLEFKLAEKLQGSDQAMLLKSVRTIVTQVSAMQRLVNEFRDYARLPSAELKPMDLNALVKEMLVFYPGSVSNDLSQLGSGSSQVPVVADLEADCPWIEGDAEQLRQVIHNLLQNAQDASWSAMEQTLGLAPPQVRIKTHKRSSNGRVVLSVIDSGTGFAPEILRRAFEPYATTKPKGTGLGLAVVKKIADDHNAKVELANRSESGTICGAQVSLSFRAYTDQPSSDRSRESRQ